MKHVCRNVIFVPKTVCILKYWLLITLFSSQIFCSCALKKNGNRASNENAKKSYDTVKDIRLCITDDSTKCVQKCLVNNCLDNIELTELYEYIAKHDSVGIYKQLIESKCIDLNKFTQLDEHIIHYAAKYNSHSLLIYLINSGVDTNVESKDNTPMLYAYAFGFPNSKTIDLLARHGADINIANDMGFAPLHYAARQADFKSMKLLVDFGADVNAKTIDAVTPLMFAACRKPKHGQFEMMEYLIKKGAKIDLIDNKYQNAMHYFASCEKDNEKLDERGIALLTSQGVDMNTRNNSGYGQTPYDIAMQMNNQELIDSFQKYGITNNVENSQ